MKKKFIPDDKRDDTLKMWRFMDWMVNTPAEEIISTFRNLEDMAFERKVLEVLVKYVRHDFLNAAAIDFINEAEAEKKI